MNTKTLHVAGLATLFAAMLGCSMETTDQGCAQLLQTTPVQYVGHAFGQGQVSLQKTKGTQIQGTLILRGERAQDPSFELAAVGTCQAGVARLRLAAGDHPNNAVRVLGGRLTLVADDGSMGGVFGMWRAETRSKDDQQERSLHGYLRQTTPDEVAAAGP